MKGKDLMKGSTGGGEGGQRERIDQKLIQIKRKSVCVTVSQLGSELAVLIKSPLMACERLLPVPA